MSVIMKNKITGKVITVSPKDVVKYCMDSWDILGYTSITRSFNGVR